MNQPLRILCLLWVLIACIGATNSHGQLVYHDSGAKTDDETLQKMYKAYSMLRDSLLKSKFPFERSDILEVGNKTFLLPEGHFNVYEWDGSTWRNRYKGPYYGYNYQSKKFVNKGIIYSYGGFGYWKWHGQIISFSPVKGEWDLVQFAKGLKNEYAFLNSQGLNILGESNCIVDFSQQKVIHQKDDSFYTTLIHEPNVYTIESEHYYLIGTNPAVIIQKEHENIFVSDSKRLRNVLKSYANPENMIVLHGDSIRIIDKTWTSIDRFDIKSEIRSWTPYVKSTYENAWYYALMILILGISFFLWQKKMRKSQATSAETLKSSDNIFIHKLTDFSGQTITLEKLDEILELDFNIHEESVRYRRLHLIKSINHDYRSTYEKDLIIRVRDPEDGRKFVYKIEP